MKPLYSNATRLAFRGKMYFVCHIGQVHRVETVILPYQSVKACRYIKVHSTYVLVRNTKMHYYLEAGYEKPFG